MWPQIGRARPGTGRECTCERSYCLKRAPRSKVDWKSMPPDFVAAACPRKRLKSSRIVTFNIRGGPVFKLLVARNVDAIVSKLPGRLGARRVGSECLASRLWAGSTDWRRSTRTRHRHGPSVRVEYGVDGVPGDDVAHLAVLARHRQVARPASAIRARLDAPRRGASTPPLGGGGGMSGPPLLGGYVTPHNL